MSEESATYISDLVTSNPTRSDKIKFGSYHLRLLKTVLRNTFPNINGPVTVNQARLNSIPDNLNLVLTSILPIGSVIAFDGAVVNLPEGWVVADGRTVAGYGVVPNLTDRFILSGTEAQKGTTGGTTGSTPVTTTAAGAHDHGGSTEPHILTVAEMPPHSHEINSSYTGGTVPNGSTQRFANQVPSDTGITGGNQPHDHGITSVANHTHDLPAFSLMPPFYRLVYICKVAHYGLS